MVSQVNKHNTSPDAGLFQETIGRALNYDVQLWRTSRPRDVSRHRSAKRYVRRRRRRSSVIDAFLFVYCLLKTALL